MEYPGKGEHALIVGQNGSGKTVVLQELLRMAEIAPIFVLDSKCDNGFLTLARGDETLITFCGGIDAFVKFLTRPPRKIPHYVIIRPPDSEVTDPQLLDLYIESIHTRFRHPCIIAVDELYMVHRNGRCGTGLAGVLTRGRSADHRLYGATQRPGWISRFCMSEPSHYYLFRLVDIDDRKRLRHTGYPDKKTLELFMFWYYAAKKGVGVMNDPITVRDDSLHANVPEKGRWL